MRFFPDILKARRVKPLRAFLLFLVRCEAAEDTADAVEWNECKCEQDNLTDLDKRYRRCSEKRTAEEDHKDLNDRYKKHYDDKWAVARDV